MGLPKLHRLRHSQDFHLVYRQGIRRNSVHLQLYALRNRGTVHYSSLPPSHKPKLKSVNSLSTSHASPLPPKPKLSIPASHKPTQLMEPKLQLGERVGVLPTRLGISISQKVSKSAVVRNRIKRQIRAALRTLLPHISPGWRIIISVRTTATECDFVDFLQELKQLLASTEVYHGHS